MPQNRTPQVVLAASAGDDLVLTAEERAHICNCRAMKVEAKIMLFDLSTIYARTLPAARPEIRLVGAPD